MKLLSLSMKDFRQFYGTTPKLNLRTRGSNRNLVVVHGANGSGKTTILNAFTWGLYGVFTRGFQHPGMLVNKKALRLGESDGEVDAWVKIEFSHDSANYLLKRSVCARLDTRTGIWSESSSDTELHVTGADGRQKVDPYPHDTIGRVLPKDLHSYFFFDGERIEQIVQATVEEKKQLGKATKLLLNVEPLHRAKRHLDDARRKLQAEFRDVGTVRVKELLGEKDVAEADLSRKRDRIEDVQLNIKMDNIGLEDIKRLLSASEGSRHLQSERADLESHLGTLTEQQEKLETEIAQVLSSKSYSVFLQRALGKFREVVEMKRSMGELPSGIKQQFIEDILNRGICICERELGTATAERRALEEWKSRAGLSDVEETLLSMGGETRRIEGLISESVENGQKFVSESESYRERVGGIRDRLDTIRQALEDSPREDVSQLEKRHGELESSIADGNQELGRLESEICRTQGDIDRIDKQIEEEELKKRRQKVARRRVEATTDCRDRVSEIIRKFEELLRKELQRRLRKMFRKMSITPYVPHLGEDWTVKLYEEAGGSALPVAASQGESQVLSLAFLGSIIGQTKSGLPKFRSLMGAHSVDYPIVMDSPFGSLDPTHRHQVSSELPRFADQLILLVTQTQWRGEVEQSMRESVARSYVLTYFTSRDDVEPVDIEVDHQRVRLVRESPDEFEYTQVFEVNNG